jgi:hypothetical protein
MCDYNNEYDLITLFSMFLIFRYLEEDEEGEEGEEGEEEEEGEEGEEGGSKSIWITHGRKHGFPLDAEWTLDGWIRGPLSSKGSGGEIFFFSSFFVFFVFFVFPSFFCHFARFKVQTD